MKDTKVRAIMIASAVIMLLIISISVILYVTTDVFKSSETLFMKYISQNFNNISEVLDISEEEKDIDLLQNNDYSDNLNLVLKYLEKQDDQEEVYTLEEEGVIENSKEKSYRNIKMAYNDNELSRIELLRENEMYGLRLANLVQQFVSIKNENMKYFISSIGYDGEYFEDKLKKVNVSGLLNFSDKEIETITNTYMKAIFAGIDKKSFSSNSNTVITLNNGESIKTNAYSLKITKNEFDKMYERILNQLAQDDIILTKIGEIDSRIREAGIILPEGETLKDRFVSKIQEISSGLEYKGEDTRIITITVYETKGITVRTELKIDTAEYGYVLDTTNSALILKASTLTETGEDVKTYSLTRTSGEEGTTRNFTYEDTNNTSLEMNLNIIKSENQIQVNGDLNLSNDKVASLNIEASSNINISSGNTSEISFNDNNNIILNNYEKDEFFSILDNLKNRFITSIEETQSKVNTKMLNNILVWIDGMEKKKAQDEQDKIESQKQTFNNQFILYAGENLSYEHVLKLMELVQENMSDIHLVSGTEIIIDIKERSKDEEKGAIIMNALDDKHSYNVNMGYSEDGYINKIQLIVVKKK